MHSPKKGLICNLNHVHLQHVSLGLHLSRHPELQDDSGALVPGEVTGCRDCRGPGGGVPEQVDANSNNPSLPCRCCDSHPLPSDIKRGLPPSPLLPTCLVLKCEEEEEEEEEEGDDAGSPVDPVSSSVSSCSDLSLDDSPVSVYYKEFPTEETLSPYNQPNIVPLEDVHHALSLADCPERSSNLNIRASECPASCVQDSPDSLCSSSSLEAPSAPISPCVKRPVRSPPIGTCSTPPAALTPPLTRPCRAPPAVPPLSVVIRTDLDSNCNALPAKESKSEMVPVFPPGQWDVNWNQTVPPKPGFARLPPPVPPRTKRGLQRLKPCEVGKPEITPAAAPAELPFSFGELQSESARRSLTSFHELAQKRKKVPGARSAVSTGKDQSDWLIIFSPDTEVPPCNELTLGSTHNQEVGPPPNSTNELFNPTGFGPREVTTFKELRYRKQKGQPLFPKGGFQSLPQLLESDKGAPEGRGPQKPETPANGHFWTPKETQPWRKKSYLGLHPIVEGGFEEAEDVGTEQKAAQRSLEGAVDWRDLWMLRKAERGDRCGAEVPPSSPEPQTLLFHFSVVNGNPAEPLHPSLCPGLKNVELSSPAPSSGPAFCPRLKTLSCEEVCLLADKQGQGLGPLSPEELLPIRLSPIGAYSPPTRSALPFLDSPDLAVLFSPLFPRSRTFPALAFPACQVPELPFGASGPLDSQVGRMSWESMGVKDPGSPEQLRHSQSFGGVSNGDHPWRADAGGVSAQLRQQKKALLMAVSGSVDKIGAHFSTARNLVQKAQLGDSRLSPDVGYLILTTLCPALRALVGDGLKPFQKDIITGQRPSSPWSVVEASAKPGPHGRSINALYWRVCRLEPLRSNQQRFHAFILGLLNMKLLEQWFFHLQKNSELISALYLPTAFLVLSKGLCRRWAEELFLLLQPLSVLTFQLDLLFEHHHLPLDVRPISHQTATPSESTAWPRMARRSSCLDSPRCKTSLPSPAEGPLAQSSPLHEPPLGVPLHQRLIKWGDRLTQTLRANEASPNPESCSQANQLGSEEKQSWWEQLSLAPGGRTNATSKQEGSSITRWTKLRMALGEAIKEARLGTEAAVASSAAALQVLSPGESGSETPRQVPHETGSSPSIRPAGKLEMTMPIAGEEAPVGGQEADKNSDTAVTPESRKGKWLGWLFGANHPGDPGCPTEPVSSMPQTSRRPSSWLPHSMNVLALVIKAAPSKKSWAEESWEGVAPDPLQPYRAVRALCDHTAAGEEHLSFHKGDILQVLDTVDEDWIQCCHGDSKGLVPISYTSLIL